MSEQTIDSFIGDNFFLSNFYESPLVVPALGVAASVEHAYQAFKTLDKGMRMHVLSASTPGEAKKRGRQLELRPNWEQIKYEIMHDLLVVKFFHGTKLATHLLATGDAELIEGNTWGDTYWGVCRGNGLNNLGKLLMLRREQLRGIPF